jgi:hypothetical protein
MDENSFVLFFLQREKSVEIGDLYFFFEFWDEF